MSTLHQLTILTDLLDKTVKALEKQGASTSSAFADIIEISKGAAEAMQSLGALQKLHQDKILKLQDRVCTLEEKITGLGH
jgi:hypothetical protein